MVKYWAITQSLISGFSRMEYRFTLTMKQKNILRLSLARR
nr:MAG TPA: hypothetical protein [Caudoviricetes sp.]